MTPEERRLVDVFMTAQAEPEGRMFSENILAGIKAVLNMRSAGPNNESVGPWKECVYKAKGAPGREDEIRNQECREIAARLRDLQKEVPEHIGGLQEARIAILERMQKREAAIQPAPTATLRGIENG